VPTAVGHGFSLYESVMVIDYVISYQSFF